HGTRNGLLAQHANLDGIYPHVGKQGIDLLSHKFCGHGTHAGYALSALSCKCCDDSHAVSAQGAHGLDVGQNAGAAGGIDSGNGEGIWDHVWTNTRSKQLPLNSTTSAESDLRSASWGRQCKTCEACGRQGMLHVRPLRLSSWRLP